ncbi:DUF748 domain-containing protein [Fulvivirgaceae bacterium BMA12]|uniref:DUF748 domain-containing protein n=1 Tax=Agaribacillus aureus TaxID=3051825 RepID=A0ABT8L0T3_9BACT|nr:DUF748 domain-containing protein [Fulvivirgaceae bacterium BMA12]
MSDKKANIKQKKAKRPGRTRRRFLRVSLSIFGILAIFQVLLFYFSDPFIRQVLQRKLMAESHGVYKIEFEKVHVNLAGLGFKIKDLSIQPNDVFLDKIKADTVKSYYNIKFPEIKVGGIGLLKLYYDRVLEIANVEITDPKMDFLGAKKFDGTNRHNKIYNDVYPFLRKYIKALLIKELKFSNGSIILENSQYGKTALSTAGDIFITLNGFRIDSTFTQDSSRLLFADHINLDIEDYRLKLSDGVHVLEAEEVNVSTATSTIQGKKLWLLPSMAPDSIKNDDNEEFYDIYIPEMKISGADIYKAYFDGVFDIDYVNLNEPEIRFITRKKFTKMDRDSISRNLYSLSSAYLDRIHVDSFEIVNGKFAITQEIDNNRPHILANDVSVAISQFLVDSSSYRNEDKIFYADDLTVDVGEYTMDLADSLHVLKAAKIEFSTLNRSAVANTVSLQPKKGNEALARRNGYELYNLSVPQLDLEGVDFKKVYNYRDLEFKKLLVENPIVKISDYSKPRASHNQLDEASLYRLIKNYVKSIAVSQIQLRDGSLEYANYKGAKKDTIRAGRIAFSLDNFKLDSVGQYTSNRIFFADNITFTLERYLMKLSDDLHILKARKVGISTIKSQIYANGIKLFPIPVKNIDMFLRRSKRSVLYNIDIPSLLINGADIRKAYFRHLLNIKTITIDKPNVVLNRYTNITRQRRNSTFKKDDLYALFEDYLKSINITKMRLNNGFFNVVTNTSQDANTLSQNNVSIEATNFVLNNRSSRNRNRIFYSDDIEVKLNNYLINLPDSIHVLRTREVGISTAKSEIYLKSSRLYPKSNRLDTVDLPAFYNVSVPTIVMEGVDINKLYYNNLLEINDIELSKPTFEIINQVEIKGKNKFMSRSRQARMPAVLKGVKIKDVKLTSGRVALGNQLGRKKQIFSTTDFSMRLNDFLLDSVILNNSRKILYADNIELDMTNYQMRLPDSIHHISARNINVSSGKKLLSAEDFRLKPRRNKNYNQLLRNQKSKLLFDVSFPKIDLTGIDLEKAYLQKNYTVRNAFIKNPDVQLISYKEPVQGDKRIDPKDILDKLLSKNLKFLNVQKLDFSGATFSLKKAKDPKSKDMLLERISGKVKNFNLNNKSRKIDSRLFYADDIDLKIKDYTYRLPDSLYTLKADEIGVSLAKSRIYMDSVVLKPKYGKFQFANKLGHEKDRVEFNARLVEFKNFDFENYILRGWVKAGVVNINNFRARNFRDKRLPFPKDQNPLMPQEWIRDFDRYLKLDLLQLKNGYVSYEEFTEDGQKPGKIEFTNVNADIRNITNSPGAWRRNDLLTIDAKAMLMGRGSIQAYFSSNLSSKQNKFTLQGTIDRFDLRDVNPMLENVAFVSVKSGQNDKMDFSFDGNNSFAVGEMRFRYSDLKITVIKKKTGDKGGFASFLANTFVINNKNPNGKNLRVGEIYFERDKKKSLFNFLWKSLLSGIKPSLGINEKNKKDKDEKASIR